MKDKLNRLKANLKIEVYDKHLIATLSEELNKVLFAKQDESKFIVWIPSDRELTEAFKNWCRINNFNDKDYKVLRTYLKEVKVVWKD